MPAPLQLEEIISAKAAKGKYLFQTEKPILPHQLALTEVQADKFEKDRAEIKKWLEERSAFCECVKNKLLIRAAHKQTMQKFNEEYPQYSQEAIPQFFSDNLNNLAAIKRFEACLMKARRDFCSTQPSGISLGFLTENDAMEFRLRWM